MLDLPPIFYVDYENLSKDYFVQEYQKDILHYVLKEKFGENSVFTFKKTKEENPRKLNITCIQCHQNLNSQNYISSSLKTLNKSSNNSIDFSFMTQDEKHNLIPWKINIRSYFPVFFISAKRNLSRDNIIQNTDIEIKTCYKNEKGCTVHDGYDSKKDAQKALTLIIGKASKNYIRKNKELSIEQVKNPILIKREDSVKIIYRNKSQLKIEAKGIAKESGAIDDVIRVDVMIGDKRNMKKKTKIKATVKAPGEVEYVF